MKATAVFANGNIEVFDSPKEDGLISAALQSAFNKNTKVVDFKIDWPKTVIHKVEEVINHSYTGTDTRCGDCGKAGIFNGDDSSPGGPSPFGVVRYYCCICGNEWKTVECAT